MRNGIYALSLLSLILFLFGCGSSQPQLPGTDYAIHIYNSTGAGITVEYPGDPSVQSRTDASDEEIAELSGPQKLVIPAYKSALIYALSARPFEIKVVSPESGAKFSQTIELEPKVRKDILVDIGGRGEFYKFPVIYSKLQNMNKPAPPDVLAQFPVQPLAGPKVLYELDKRYDGINKRPKSQTTSTEKMNYGAIYILVDASGLRRASEGQQLDP